MLYDLAPPSPNAPVPCILRGAWGELFRLRVGVRLIVVIWDKFFRLIVLRFFLNLADFFA